jgi:transposase
VNNTSSNIKDTSISIGLDVSKESISVYIPINKLDLEIENSLKGLKKLLSKLKKLYKKEFVNLVFVFEPTGSYSELLRKFCAEKEIKAFILNPKRSSNFAKSSGNRSKTDKADARLLSDAIVLDKKGETKVPTIDLIVETIKERMSYYKLIIKQRVMTNNHLESVVSKDGDRYVVKALEKEIKNQKAKEKEIINEIKNIIDSDDEMSEDFENIKTISGIGEIGAIVLLHLFIKYPNANKKQLTSLVGLDPIRFDSGSSIKRRTRISKAGSVLYRGTLFMGVLVAVKHNREMEIFFNRLKDNGKHTTQAHIAVMRKMIIIAHSLYKNKQKYSSEIYRKHCGICEG